MTISFAFIKKNQGILCLTTFLIILYFYKNQLTLSQAFYFDEMWKLDLIASSTTLKRYFTNNAPIPVGWLFLCKAVVLFSDSGSYLRFFTYFCFLGFLFFLYKFLLSFKRISKSAALCIVSILAINSIYIEQYSHFCQYSFEMLISILLLYYFEQRKRSNYGKIVFYIILILVPVLSISTLFFLPTVSLMLLIEKSILKEKIISSSVIWLSLILSMIIFKFFYFPVIDNSLIAFWKSKTNGIFSEIFHFVFLPFKQSNFFLGLNEKVFFFFAAFGLIALSLNKRFNFNLKVIFFGTFFTVILASAFSNWPFILSSGEGRVNLGWSWILNVSFLLSLINVYNKIRNKILNNFLLISTFLVFFLGTGQGSIRERDFMPFRYLDRDINTINLKMSNEKKNCFVSMHFMSHFYLNYYSIEKNKNISVTYYYQRQKEGALEFFERINTQSCEILWVLVPFESGEIDIRKISEFSFLNFKKNSSFKGIRSIAFEYERIKERNGI